MENNDCIVSTIYDGKQRKLFKQICKQCGKDFHVPKHVKRIYCSKQCFVETSTKRIKLICDNCGNEMDRTLSDLNSSVHKKYFCSRKCKEIAQSFLGNCPEIRPKHYGSNKSYEGRIKKDRCISCGENRKFLLFTHHIDGDREHNAVANLECVCPTCHVIRHLYLYKGRWIYSTKVLTPRELIPELTCGPIAHLGEHYTCNVEAVGS